MSQVKEDNIIELAGSAAKPGKAVKDRWPQPVLAQGYNVIPTILFWGQDRLGVTPEEFNVLLQIISHWWVPGRQPFLSKEDLAERMGLHPRTVQIHIARLERKGLIKRVKRLRFSGGQGPNGFDLRGLIDKLNEIAPEFKAASEQARLRRQNAG